MQRPTQSYIGSMHNKPPGRITYLADGTHSHHLASVVRLHDSSTTITRFIRWVKQGNRTVPSDEVPLALDRDIFDIPSSTDVASSLEAKYGRYKEVVGWGSSSTVKISYKPNPHSGQQGHLYAVKAFRKRAKESESAYRKRASAEFCIASALRHGNVIHTLDLLSDDRGHMCQVMEFCAAGDLCALLLSATKFDEVEADCLYKQLLRGLVHCHAAGVAHRDLKPENILLTTNGCLKISDFGTAECVQYAWEETGHRSTGLHGSRPYMAPEVFSKNRFDARAVDVWATGVIYMAMRTGRLMWAKASYEDEQFKKFAASCEAVEGFRPIEALSGVSTVSA